jgi:hypothetical protein
VAVAITRREGDHLRGAFVVKPPAVAFHDSAPPLHCRHPAVAARLEGIAQPAAICRSEDAYRQVRARLDLEVNDLGQKELKNIVEPVRAYSLRVGFAHTKPATTVDVANEEKPAPRLALPDRPSIAVLPFVNMSGDPSRSTLPVGSPRI